MTVDKGKRPSDPNQLAKWLVDKATSGPDDGEAMSAARTEISAYMASIGRKGGQIGGKKRLKTMTKEERRKVASKAARARWKKSKKNA